MIRHYLRRKAGTKIMQQVSERLAKSFELLADHPQMGRERPEIGDTLRSYTVQPYIIFYRIQVQTPYISRIIHGERDLLAVIEENLP